MEANINLSLPFEPLIHTAVQLSGTDHSSYAEFSLAYVTFQITIEIIL